VRHHVGDMPSARRSHGAHDLPQCLEIRAARMDCAFDVGLGSRPELGVDHLFMGSVYPPILLQSFPEEWITLN
jgi:hypothetical protein